jgi:hypothetical protein
MRICLDNREADIASFLSRNFSPDRIATLAKHFVALGLHKDQAQPQPAEQSLPYSNQDPIHFADAPEADDLSDIADSRPVLETPGTNSIRGSPAVRACLESGARHYKESLPDDNPLPPHGTWEVAAVINGNVEYSLPTSEFLHRVVNANPRYTYVPMWTANFKGDHWSGNPHVMDEAYQSLIYDPPDALSFWRAETRGFLYQVRALEDDISRIRPMREPMKTLEFVIATLRVTESILVAIAIAKALPMRSPAKTVEFLFRWSELSGRELSNWNNVAFQLPNGLTARQNTVVTSVTVPIDATRSAIVDFVSSATCPMLAVFGGFSPDSKTMFDIVNILIERRF